MAMRDSVHSRNVLPMRLLPEGTLAFLGRRLIEAGGFALGLLALALFFICLTYSPADPSLNHATGAPVRNMLGVPGAYVADVLVQTLGLAAFLLPPVLLAWGWRLVRDHRLKRWTTRLAAFPLGLVAGALALAVLPVPDAWLAGLSLGGAGGTLLAWHLADSLGLGTWVLGVAGFAIAAGALVYSAGITLGEWLNGWRMTGRAGGWALAWGAARGAALTRALLRARSHRRVKTAPARREPEVVGSEASPSEPPLEPPLERAPEPASSGPARTRGEAKPAAARRARASRQQSFDLPAFDGGTYSTPPRELLHLGKVESGDAINRDSLEKNARLLEGVLDDFGVRGEIVKVRPGPVVTRYDLEPAPGTKTSRVVGLADDIARSMSAVSVRVAVVPGSSVIGIELPNGRRETVYLRELLSSRAYDAEDVKLPLVLGKDIGGAPQIVDLGRMPHLLIAGTTGSGKSVAVNAMILSLVYRLGPEKCKFIMIDPKMLELSVYNDIPHLLAQVVTEPKKAVVALKWTVREMEDRYRAMSRLGVRNIDGYNARVQQAQRNGEVLTRRVQTGFDPETGQPVHEEQPIDLEALSYIVVVVDELADLMLVAGKDVEAAIQRLAQMARAAGIHLIVATQRPSVDVITGTIKANFPTRISFHVTSKIDSRTILGEQGAEQLLGQGDMLYMAHGGRITRVHGPLVTDQEVEDVVAFLKKQGPPSYIETVTEDDDTGFEDFGGAGGSGDELYDQAVAMVLQTRKASTSFVQRQFQIGYNKAARLIERMEAEGVVSAANHVGKREVLAPGGKEE